MKPVKTVPGRTKSRSGFIGAGACQTGAKTWKRGKSGEPSGTTKPAWNYITKTSASPQATADRASRSCAGAPGNVDKIRDILFGTQMRDYESRFARLEETLIKETMEIRETSRRRFDQLESYVRKEFETLQSRVKSERDERSDVDTQHARDLKDSTDLLSRRIRDLDDRSAQVERDLRNDLLQQARDLTEELRARHEDISTLLEKRFHELREGKTDRAALATLFSEVALRLSDQFQIPGSEE